MLNRHGRNTTYLPRYLRALRHKQPVNCGRRLLVFIKTSRQACDRLSKIITVYSLRTTLATRLTKITSMRPWVRLPITEQMQDNTHLLRISVMRNTGLPS